MDLLSVSSVSFMVLCLQSIDRASDTWMWPKPLEPEFDLSAEIYETHIFPPAPWKRAVRGGSIAGKKAQ